MAKKYFDEQLMNMSSSAALEENLTESRIYDKQNGLWYELQGDYYIPCLTLPTEENQPICIWGQHTHNRQGIARGLVCRAFFN